VSGFFFGGVPCGDTEDVAKLVTNKHITVLCMCFCPHVEERQYFARGQVSVVSLDWCGGCVESQRRRWLSQLQAHPRAKDRLLWRPWVGASARVRREGGEGEGRSSACM